MDKIVIDGGQRLQGSIVNSGAKNAALPILIATLLAPGEHRIANVPMLADVSSTLSLLGRIGCPSVGTGCVRVDTSRIVYREAPDEVVRQMRASFLVLGPLLARCGEAHVSLPGGDAIGSRPIDQHLKGLQALGCTFEQRGGMVHGSAPHGLHGATIRLDMPTVGGTENIVMAAVLARGTTEIHNAAREPEVVDLCAFLCSLGARIDGAGTSTITIHGVDRLWPANRPYPVMPDRIEAGTYLCAAAMTCGDLEIRDTDPSLLDATLAKLEEAGCTIETARTSVRLRADGPLRPFRIRTEPYPGLATDMQAQLMALALVADGTSTIEETVFENRFMHAAELQRLGADIHTSGRIATVHGGRPLAGASVRASDVRASAALVLAGLVADGMTEVLRIGHLDRGYERLVEKLAGTGARIARVDAEMIDPTGIAQAMDRGRASSLRPTPAEA